MKSKTKGLRKLTLNDFLKRTIPMLAVKKYPDRDAEDAVRTLTETICVSQGPLTICTVEEADGLFQTNQLTPLSGRHSFSQSPSSKRNSMINTDSPMGRRSSIRRTSILNRSTLSGSTRNLNSNLSVQKIFESYCTVPLPNENFLMDCQQFIKLCRDGKFTNDKGSTNTTSLELIFTRVKPQGIKKISYKEFDQALYLLAEKKYPDMTVEEGYASIQNDIINILGPLVAKKIKQMEAQKNKKDIFDKLTDESLYTGAHIARFEHKGIEGRTQNTAGVASLSDICRK